MDIGLTKMSTKGQIVIPADLRADFQVGEKLIVIKNKDQLIIKKASKVDEQFVEDLEFARRTEEAYKRIESGKGKTMEFDAFIEEMKKW